MPTSAERFRAARDASLAAATGAPGFRRTLALTSLPGVAVAIVGLFTASLIVVLGAVVALAGPAAYYAVLRSRASASAKRETMTSWASERGWSYVESPPLPGDVAFCRGRQRMVASDGFEGPICSLPGTIFNFTYSTFETRTRTSTDASGNVQTQTYQQEVKHRHTVLRLTMGVATGVRTMQLADRGLGFLDKLQAAFGASRLVETESVEFNRRFSLSVNDGADQSVVLRIFTPALLVRLVEGAFPHTAFQYESGALAYIWGDQYDVEQLEEVEQRVASVSALTIALHKAITPLS
ncbi:MAG: hypothetical protein QOG02_1448 [Gaiellales bacterium]|jgi:hypothetical protein|nr:hypothetical protein [Gaiellales bacterium]